MAPRTTTAGTSVSGINFDWRADKTGGNDSRLERGTTRAPTGAPKLPGSASHSRPISGMSMNRVRSVAVVLSLICLTVRAEVVYQEPRSFIEDVFAHQPPTAGALWLTEDLKGPVRKIMGHDLKTLRIRYWALDGRSAWILEEIGKVKPITTGVVVDRGRIEQIRVLVFRESRGWEVRHDFFTDQFRDAALDDRYRLDRSIDSISGATLSVRALTRIARLALFLSRQIDTDAQT